MKKTQKKKNHFFPLPPAPSPGYPQDPDPEPDPDPHEDFCPDPGSQKKNEDPKPWFELWISMDFFPLVCEGKRDFPRLKFQVIE